MKTPVTPSPQSGWSEWRPLAFGEAVSASVLAEILDGGQAFRWRSIAADRWLGVFDGIVVELVRAAKGQVHWSTPLPLQTIAPKALAVYFDLARNASVLADALPWRSDAHLDSCISAFTGLRILRQPFGETLLGFLCSATKQIVQIKQMLALLAERHGAVLTSAAGNGAATQTALHRLPTWAELAEVPESELRACLLGFR